MLTIAGSGVNLYSFAEVAQKISWEQFDCLISDLNFDNEINRSLIPTNIELIFLPFGRVKETIKDKLLEGRKIIYIVTGSPIFYSATGKILKYLEAEITNFQKEHVDLIYAESSKDYLLRKLKILENEVSTLSLHGRHNESLELTKFLSTKYNFILCDEHSIKIIMENTTYIKDELIYYLGSKLGSEKELIVPVNVSTVFKELSPEQIKEQYMPYVILIEKKYYQPMTISKTEDFNTIAGMITKTDKRALTLQALDLRPDMLLWDIGAGSGSISIDSYKIFKTRSVLFEKNPEQILCIKENLTKHRVAGAKLIEGNVLDSYKNLEKPDRIFIGGGGEEVLTEVISIFNELKLDGIMVINIIGLENLALVIQDLKKTTLNYEIRSIDITNYKKLSKGALSIPEPERTLFQLIMKK